MAKIKAGDLRQMITLMRPMSQIGARGRRETEWDEIPDVPAAKSDVSGREFFEAHAYNAEDIVTFTIRTREIDDRWRVRHHGTVYNILEVNHLGYMEDFLRLKCRAVAGGGS